jgi:hypothetical protein
MYINRILSDSKRLLDNAVRSCLIHVHAYIFSISDGLLHLNDLDCVS